MFISWKLQLYNKRPLQPILEVVLGVSMLSFDYKNLHCFTFKALSDNQLTGKMTTLTAKDKANVKAFWAKIAPKADDIGADALSR